MSNPTVAAAAPLVFIDMSAIISKDRKESSTTNDCPVCSDRDISMARNTGRLLLDTTSTGHCGENRTGLVCTCPGEDSFQTLPSLPCEYDFLHDLEDRQYDLSHRGVEDEQAFEMPFARKMKFILFILLIVLVVGAHIALFYISSVRSAAQARSLDQPEEEAENGSRSKQMPLGYLYGSIAAR